MSVVDISTWKPFQLIGVNGLFDTYSSGQISVARNLVDGDMPYVGAVFSDKDNGVVRYVTPSDVNQVTEGNCIACVCDGAAIGTNMYQPDDFVGTTNLKMLHGSFLNLLTGLFLVTALNAACKQRGYSYFDKRNSDAFCREVVLLPATPDGEPDWAYMEAYMQQVLDREEMFAEHLASLTAEAVADGHVIDTSMWKAFKVGDLFDVLLAKGDIQPNLVGDGNVPLVSAGTTDNGIVATISDKGDGISEVFSAGCLTVSMFGTAFWQNEPFYAVSHGRVNVLMPKRRVSDTVGLFLASAVNACFNGEYDYSTMCTRKRLLDATVTLPATPDGTPDWAYMERYMRDVMAAEALFADELDRLSRE